MSESTHLKGNCLCGAVGMSATPAGTSVGACHCGMCRKWGGGPFMTIEGGTSVSMTGEMHVAVFASSEWAERGFCRNCGTHLFYRLKANQHYFLPAGIFDLDSQAHFDHQVFVDEKPDFYSFSNKTRDMTGAELFAMYTADKKE